MSLLSRSLLIFALPGALVKLHLCAICSINCSYHSRFLDVIRYHDMLASLTRWLNEEREKRRAKCKFMQILNQEFGNTWQDSVASEDLNDMCTSLTEQLLFFIKFQQDTFKMSSLRMQIYCKIISEIHSLADYWLNNWYISLTNLKLSS